MSSKDNFFIGEEKFRTIDIHRLVYLVITLWAYGITELGRFVYRPYIYQNNINDYGLADAIGNLGGIVVQIFFMLAVFNPPKKKAWIFMVFLPLGYIAYEILQPYLPKGVYDIKDVWGSLIGGVIAALIYVLIKKSVSNKTIYKFGNK